MIEPFSVDQGRRMGWKMVTIIGAPTAQGAD